MDPIIAGGLIGGGAGLLGGAISSINQNRQNRLNREAQEEFARHGVQWRVEDAKKAGVHPLFALGASTTGFTPSPVMPDDYGIAEAGQAIGNAVTASATQPERRLINAQLDALHAGSMKDFAEASYWASMSHKINMEGLQTKPFPEVSATGKLQWLDDVSGAEIRSSIGADDFRKGLSGDVGTPRMLPSQGIAEGETPAFSKWRYDQGWAFLLPFAGGGFGQGNSQLAESIEGIPMAMWPMIIKRNVDEFGPGWVKGFAMRFPGIASALRVQEGARQFFGSPYDERGKRKPFFPQGDAGVGSIF
ncbi:MAG: DNA pilot protein [Microviridae sp.]|nr:MAG: DNA pilot protein [Microviridae sp.]